MTAMLDGRRLRNQPPHFPLRATFVARTEGVHQRRIDWHLVWPVIASSSRKQEPLISCRRYRCFHCHEGGTVSRDQDVLVEDADGTAMLLSSGATPPDRPQRSSQRIHLVPCLGLLAITCSPETPPVCARVRLRRGTDVKKTRSSEEHIIAVLREQEGGMKTAAVRR